jgi:hypothetical protein
MELLDKIKTENLQKWICGVRKSENVAKPRKRNGLAWSENLMSGTAGLENLKIK